MIFFNCFFFPFFFYEHPPFLGSTNSFFFRFIVFSTLFIIIYLLKSAKHRHMIIKVRRGTHTLFCETMCLGAVWIRIWRAAFSFIIIIWLLFVANPNDDDMRFLISWHNVSLLLSLLLMMMPTPLFFIQCMYAESDFASVSFIYVFE